MEFSQIRQHEFPEFRIGITVILRNCRGSFPAVGNGLCAVPTLLAIAERPGRRSLQFVSRKNRWIGVGSFDETSLYSRLARNVGS